MALTVGMDVARSSLAVTAEQISIVSRNVGRAGDADATKKTAVVVTGPGATVRVARIERAYDPLLLEKYLSANSSASGQGAISSALDQLQATVDDTDLERSPAALISKLNAALQQYSASPSNAALAGSVVSAAKDLASALNAASNTVASVRQQADKDIATSVAHVNDLLGQFATLNKEVVSGTRAGSDVTDALDARDAILKQLSGEIGIRTTARADGDMAIYTESGVTMFDVVPRSVTFAPATVLASGAAGSPVYVDNVPVLGTPQVMAVSNGKLAGLVAVRDQITPVYETQIDEIARGLIEAFAETDQSAVPTLPPVAGLFTYPGAPAIPPTGTIVNGLAGLISVNASVDPSQGGNLNLLRDGGISNTGNPAYTYNLSGNASYGDRIQDLITKLGTSQAFDPASNIGSSATVGGYATSSVSWLEGLRQSAQASADYQNTLSQRASSALSKDTGVSLDDEMAKMLALERTYQASSRLITTIDSMLQSLLSSLG